MVAVSEYTVVNYIFYKQIIENIGFILLGFVLLVMLSGKLPIAYLFFFCFAFCLFSFFFAMYYLIRCSNLGIIIRKTFIMDLILDAGYCVVFMAYALVFMKVLDVSLLPFFIIPHIILMTVRMCSSFNRQTHVENQVWAFLEAFQILWISIKIASPQSQPDCGCSSWPTWWSCSCSSAEPFVCSAWGASSEWWSTRTTTRSSRKIC